MSTEILRFFILLCFFAATVLLVQLGLSAWSRHSTRSSAVNQRLRLIARGLDRELVTARLRKRQPKEYQHLPPFVASRLVQFQQMLNAAGIGLSAAQIMMAMAGGALAITALLIIAAGMAGYRVNLGTMQLALALAIGAAVTLPLLIVSRIAQNRRKKMERQFPVALDIFVRGLRAGHPVNAAIELLTKEMDDPIGTEFGIVYDEVTYGSDLRDALSAMANRWGISDMHMFVVSLAIQNETGGNLAEILENLSAVIRERASMYMKVRALSSEGRMTAFILTLLPVAAFLLLFLINPTFYLDVAQDPMFLIGFTGLIGLYSVGFITIRKMIDLKV